MALLIYGLPALVGFIIGYFFATWLLVVITVIAVAVSIYCLKTMQEIEKLIAMMVACVCLIGISAMWITYYLSTDQTWLGDIIEFSILR